MMNQLMTHFVYSEFQVFFYVSLMEHSINAFQPHQQLYRNRCLS